MQKSYLKKLNMPENPGVYIFRDYRKRPLYIGRATSLRDRVKSYFANDLIETRGPRIVDMVTKAKSLTWQETPSVLEAILLESTLIKRYQPYYNVDERDDKSAEYVVITEEEWPRVFLARARDLESEQNAGTLPYDIGAKYGPFVEAGLIKTALKILRRLFPFRDRKAHDPRHEEFYRAIGRSPEKTGDRSHADYLKTIKYLSLFFEGKSQRVKTMLARDMKRHAKAMQFELASADRKLIYALDHINDIALIKQAQSGQFGGKNLGSADATNPATQGARDFRMEAYDIAHLSGTNVVGAMVVSNNGRFAPAEYRKFKLKRQANDDIAGLVEILSRRLNHSEWAYPDLIVADGGEAQLRAVEAVLRSRRITIPVVAVTKDERHKAESVIGHAEYADKHRQAIVALNAECHRFAIAFHRAHRRKTALI